MTPADVQVTFCATLVDQWIDMGMQHAVVAPGSRSTPMALALAARTDLQVHVAHDERTAAFMALGVGLSTGVPAALLCTSGTAAAHFHAAVIEADLSGVPMIVLTADRPPELQGVGAPQTIDQVELYGDVVRLFADLGVPDAEATAAWRGTAVNAWLAACGIDPGPVHLNLPFREPLVGHIGELPALDPGFEGPDDEVWFMTRLSMEELAAMLTAPRGVVVAGNGVDDPDAAGALAAALGWPILADPRSGCRRLRAAVCAFDPLLRDAGFAAANRPDVVLHLGEPPASKVLGQWLQASGAVHVQVHPQGRTIDPLGIVTERVYGSVGTVCEALTPLVAAPADSTWLAGWMAAESAAQSTLTSAPSTPVWCCRRRCRCAMSSGSAPPAAPWCTRTGGPTASTAWWPRPSVWRLVPTGPPCCWWAMWRSATTSRRSPHWRHGHSISPWSSSTTTEEASSRSSRSGALSPPNGSSSCSAPRTAPISWRSPGHTASAPAPSTP
jgi:2-succinyl-5-enolpyruvyl-6-hydroxy-3-cyclohexene-1-carboxylate synthase